MILVPKTVLPQSTFSYEAEMDMQYMSVSFSGSLKTPLLDNKDVAKWGWDPFQFSESGASPLRFETRRLVKLKC
jgi:hypothetical protein